VGSPELLDPPPPPLSPKRAAGEGGLRALRAVRAMRVPCLARSDARFCAKNAPSTAAAAATLWRRHMPPRALPPPLPTGDVRAPCPPALRTQ